jgi:hypothetical protein
MVITARVAGLSYVLIIALGLCQNLFVALPLLVPGDPAATANNIAQHELLFRIGILSDTTLYALVLLLSVALFLLLRGVSRPIALAALVLRSAEGVVGLAVTLLGGMMPLLLLDGQTSADSEVLQVLAVSFLDLRTAGLDVVLILIGLDGGAFCYLFFKSRCVPSSLAVWGIFTYVSMLALASARLVLPAFSASAVNVLYAQGALFEIVFAVWLLVKAVDASRLTTRGDGGGGAGVAVST